MPQISFTVPEVQVLFMMELLKKFEFVDNTALQTEDYRFSKELIQLVENERMKCKENSNYLLDLDNIIVKMTFE